MKKRGKFIDWQKKAHKEKIFITVLIIGIVLLTLYLGYDFYDSFKTKAETETEISYLNGAIVLLNEEKSQLILEQDTLNQTVTLLNQQVIQLISDKGDLTLELDELQEDYDTCSAELQDVEDELDDCEPSP